MKKIIKGYLFITSGCEHGPTIMKWNKEKWNQKRYEELEKASWCDNNFNYDAEEVELDLTPGKKYKLTIEEVV